MDLVYATLAGVVVGAVLAVTVSLAVLRRRADRDLIERRIRACADLREALGDIELWLGRQPDSAAVLEQAWWGVGEFCREFRRTGWLLESSVRERLETMVGSLEEERARCERSETGKGHAAQLLCQQVREIDRLLRRTTTREARAFERFHAPEQRPQEVEEVTP